MDPAKRNKDTDASDNMTDLPKNTQRSTEQIDAADEITKNHLPSVVTTTPTTKFPAGQAIRQGQLRKETPSNHIADGEETNKERLRELSEPAPLTLYAAPPMDDDEDDGEYENEGDFGMSERERQDGPGAHRVAGPNPRQMSQLSFLYFNQGSIEEEAKESADDTSLAPSNVVAVVVDDDQLFNETLTRLQLEVVEAKNVVAFDEESGVDNEEKSKKHLHLANPKKRAIAVAIIALAIAAAVIAVLVSRSNNEKSKLQTHTPSPAKPPTAPNQPTAAPSSPQEAFRSVLLDYNVSSSQSLDHYESPQNDAFNWLVNMDDFLAASSPAESIIDRYVLAVVYYADGGNQWNDNQSNFLRNDSICGWHDSVINGTGAFCTTSMNVLLGKQTLNVSHGFNHFFKCQQPQNACPLDSKVPCLRSWCWRATACLGRSHQS